eukprot:9474462-Ditylum_brightwellii.AAC.1
MGEDIEITITDEAAFKNRTAKKQFYSKYNSKDDKQAQEVDLRRCPTENTDEKYWTKGTNQRFLPDDGNLPLFECDIPFEHLIVGTSKVAQAVNEQ